jgi:hypothetical protein
VPVLKGRRELKLSSLPTPIARRSGIPAYRFSRVAIPVAYLKKAQDTFTEWNKTAPDLWGRKERMYNGLTTRRVGMRA